MLKNGDRVKFVRTSDPELDSITGKVVGVVSNFPTGSFMIVMMDRKHSKYDYDAIVMTEHCLELLGE